MTGFYSCQKTDKNFKSLHGFEGHRLEITEVCMDFEPYFMVYNSVSVHPNNIIPSLGQMTNLNMNSHVVVPVYGLFKIENSPQFPSEFRNGQYVLFFQFRKACNLCRADRTSIISRKLQLEFLIK